MRKIAKKKSVKPEFKAGDEVIVESLTITQPRHGIHRHMEEMVGDQYVVHETRTSNPNKVVLKTEKGDKWVFASEDLVLITDANKIQSEAMPVDPIMFDPKELV